jgi:hypothetical protein
MNPSITGQLDYDYGKLGRNYTPPAADSSHYVVWPMP